VNEEDRKQKLKAAAAFMAIAGKPLPEPKKTFGEEIVEMYGDQFPWLRDVDLEGDKK
jgi:hypothetical protein